MKENIECIRTETDHKNAQFWNELCGSHQAKQLGINNNSIDSLSRFDDWYFDFYPYLLPYIQPARMRESRVLEVGLGYGSLGQKIAGSGADYTGMDLAIAPVEMMRYRLSSLGLSGKAIQGNILYSPFASNSFDYVVSIGCFHHTGNIQRCLQETHRILRPGGEAFIMVYNALSYWQWRRWPLRAFRAWLSATGTRSTIAQRIGCDANEKGDAAPETIFLSIGQLRGLTSMFSSSSFTKENCRDFSNLGFLPSRKKLLPTLGRWLGLDIYLRLKK